MPVHGQILAAVAQHGTRRDPGARPQNAPPLPSFSLAVGNNLRFAHPGSRLRDFLQAHAGRPQLVTGRAVDRPSGVRRVGLMP